MSGKKRDGTYNKTTVHFFQNAFFVERHCFALPFLDSFFFQLFTGVHLTGGAHLAGANLENKQRGDAMTCANRL